MAIWFLLVLMTVLAMAAVLWPLARRRPVAGCTDLEVYQDQLDEISRDRNAGLIDETEAEAAKVEVSRRLIAAADAASVQNSTPGSPSLWGRRAGAIAGLVFLPVGTVALYLMLGSPQMVSESAVAQQAIADEDRSVAALVARVEAHVAQNPADGRAWDVLAPVYMRLGRFEDAVRAWRTAIKINGATASRLSDLGEALAANANGVVTAEAKAAFDQALALDPQDVMARFYSGMAAEQDGKHADADKIWGDLLASAPPDAPWIETVQRAMARTTPVAAAGNAPAEPSASQVAAAAKLAPDQQTQMIEGMVARLAERLKKDGSDAAGWARLVRSYRVLGDADRAQAAEADARRALASDPEKLRQFNEGGDAAVPPIAAPAPGPSQADVEAAQKMNPAEQNQMIGGMVARLAERLKANGDDVAGWQRLLRAYKVLGDSDKATAAAADARRALANDPVKLRQIDDAITELGLKG